MAAVALKAALTHQAKKAKTVDLVAVVPQQVAKAQELPVKVTTAVQAAASVAAGVAAVVGVKLVLVVQAFPTTTGGKVVLAAQVVVQPLQVLRLPEAAVAAVTSPTQTVVVRVALAGVALVVAEMALQPLAIFVVAEVLG